MGVSCRCLAFDISNREETRNCLINDIEKNGVYYGVVLNAGIAKDNPLPAMEDIEWDNVINTNLNGFYNISLSEQLADLEINGEEFDFSSLFSVGGEK